MFINFLSEDTVYRSNFRKITGQTIYQEHINRNYISCIFCSRLKKSQCHNNCFICSESVYKDCSSLLPGTYDFGDSYFDSLGTGVTPWIFKTPCTRFERLKSNVYFRNFLSSDRSTVTAAYEALEGLYNGICRGKRPCHICASVNLDIFNNCSKTEKDENKPCRMIKDEISSIYRTFPSMVLYAD